MHVPVAAKCTRTGCFVNVFVQFTDAIFLQLLITIAQLMVDAVREMGIGELLLQFRWSVSEP